MTLKITQAIRLHRRAVPAAQSLGSTATTTRGALRFLRQSVLGASSVLAIQEQNLAIYERVTGQSMLRRVKERLSDELYRGPYGGDRRIAVGAAFDVVDRLTEKYPPTLRHSGPHGSKAKRVKSAWTTRLEKYLHRKRLPKRFDPAARTYIKSEQLLIDEERRRQEHEAMVFEAVVRYESAVSGQLRYRESQSAWAGGNHEVKIHAGSPSCAGGSDRAWSDNGKWSGNDSYIRLTVSERLLFDGSLPRVVNHRAALDAERLADGVYRIVWAEQSRGFDVRAASGFLIGSELIEASDRAAAEKAYSRRHVVPRLKAC